MMNRELTLVSLIAALSTPPVGAQAVEYARAVRAATARLTEGGSGALSQPAEIEVRGVPLADALTLLSERARVPIAFSASLLPGRSHRVDCPCQTVTVGIALERLLTGTTLDFMEVHGQIVIFPSVPAELARLQLATTLPQPPDVGGRDLPEALLSEVGNASLLLRERPLVATLRGKITETGSGRPLGGVQVLIVGLGRSAVTNAAGDYTMLDVPDGTFRVRAHIIGHSTAEQTVTVASGQAVQVDFVLSFLPITIDEQVVTGTAGPVSKRTLGNAITTINAADVMEKVVNMNVAELLQARAPGVTILQSSGTPGSASTIRIRGVTSLNGASDEPVIYVDGVRVNSSPGGVFRNSYQQPAQGITAGGGQTASALDAINPDDIESLEVIKGPAAATLYGADAANGVIQIITKKGRVGDQKLQWNAKVQLGQSAWGLDRRPSFTTCDAVRLADSATWPGCNGLAADTKISATFLDDVLRSGDFQNVSLSVRGGGRGYSFYGALDNDKEQGIFSNSRDGRTSTRANLSLYPTDKVDFSVNLGYTRIKTAFPMTDNGPTVLEAAWTYAPGRAPQPGQPSSHPYGDPALYEQYENTLEGDRVTLGTTLTYRPLTRFRHRLTVGADISAQQANRYVPPQGLFDPVSLGQMTQGAPRNNVYTLDYAGTVDHTLPLGRLPSTFSFGVQYNNKRYENTIAQGTGFVSTAVKDVASATTRNSWDEFAQVKSLGFFVQEQVAWRDRLYVTVAVREDNSSVFGSKINQLYYPKLSAAYVISEEPFMRKYSWLDNLKLRLAWGEAGNAPDPFAKGTTYGFTQTVDDQTGQVISALRLRTVGNPDVTPERGSEIEAGFEAALLGNRLGIEWTYYHKTTKDALMSVPLTPSVVGGTGVSQLQNVGEITNTGIELSILATPIRNRHVTWDARLGFAGNRNRLARFGYGAPFIPYGLTTENQRTAEGYPLAGYWVHDPVPDGAGGYKAGPARFLGSSLPTREASLSNTFTILGRLQLHTLLDYKGGHYLLNQTDWRRCLAGVCAEVNDPNVLAARKTQLQLPLQVNDALYTQRADFIKVRDVSLSYTLPTEWTSRFWADRIAVMLAAHNLGFLWKPDYTGLDPEVTFNGVNQTGGDGQAFGWVRTDYWTPPMLRRFTMSFDVSF
jgi:TonB-dependent starch-binding outer membrane protein SusC